MYEQSRFPVVGIGASAGGIRAMESFFAGVPALPNAAFVVVTHLNPERESLLTEVVGRFTSMPVHTVSEATRLEPNHVYVMPPNVVMTIKGGCLEVHPTDGRGGARKPIDVFFSSLAQDQREHAVCVILSGGDGDGTLGAKAVKECGGLTLAQAFDGAGPDSPDMPQSAIATGLIDIAAPAKELGARITAFARGFDTLAQLAGDPAREKSEVQAARTEIHGLLRDRSGHDFSGYKVNTFMRRIGRRMQILQLQSLQDYVDRLRNEHSEVNNLFKDLLINVTNFFRDADAFRALEELVIPKLFEGRAASNAVRVWVPGCATGEEVYSLGILLREQLDRIENPPRVQIFATDIDEAAMGVARAARYPELLLDGLSAERRERFFTRDGASFVLNKDVRELCIFSPHSVFRDPPFSRMDLVSCRNLLIYLGPEVQNRVIPTFHYSLKDGGYLFLGTSEHISQHAGLFAAVDKKNRIFQSRGHMSNGRQLAASLEDPGVPGEEIADERRPIAAYGLRQAVESRVLERFAPAHVVVNAGGDVVYYSARTGRFLEPAQGAPNRQILTMARRSLRFDLRAALRDVLAGGDPVARMSVLDDDSGRIQPVAITVEPVANRNAPESLFLVVFETGEAARSHADPAQGALSADSIETEAELRDTRERLQSTIEEYETALEELKSSNEELISVNEEAQSTNEELEASREEMQSLNEELKTINAELTVKVEELHQANGDLNNLFESSQVATVFLDRRLVIRNFTPAASTFFNLRPVDVGRPLTDLSSKLEYPDLQQHIASVFRTGQSHEHQLPRDRDGKHYLVRVIPYRNESGRSEGAVVTLLDVTGLAAAEDHQRVLIAELNHRVKNLLAVVISITNHTLKRASSPENFASALTGRLHAMARAYALLSRNDWREASVKALIEQEIQPFSGERFVVDGPELQLSAQQGLSVSMVIHELATNASKYGALSSATGSVHLEWHLADGRFQLKWEERDGPTVHAPDRDGFGLSLVRGEIEYRLGGQVSVSFLPPGLLLQMAFAVRR